jgi:hypothetical protein
LTEFIASCSSAWLAWRLYAHDKLRDSDTRCPLRRSSKDNPSIIQSDSEAGTLTVPLLSEDGSGISSMGAPCATLLPWMPANRNGNVGSQVSIANRSGLLVTHAPPVAPHWSAFPELVVPNLRFLRAQQGLAVAVGCCHRCIIVSVSAELSSPHSTASLSSSSLLLSRHLRILAPRWHSVCCDPLLMGQNM